MPEITEDKYTLIGKSVDIQFCKAGTEAVHERKVIGLENGLLICTAPDGVTEWLPLSSIHVIIDRTKSKGASPVQSYYNV